MKSAILFSLSLINFLSVASLAHADFLDRVDTCEKTGSTACIFDLLRELGNHMGGAGNPPPVELPLRSGEFWDSATKANVGVFGNSVSIAVNDQWSSYSCAFSCIGLTCDKVTGDVCSSLIITGKESFTLVYANGFKRDWIKK